MVKLMYEDFIWICIQALVLTGQINVPELADSKIVKTGLVLSFSATAMSLLAAFNTIFTRSWALDEEVTTCMMNLMTANCQWVPYESQIAQGKLDKCVDFTNINGALPFGFSYATGFYMSFSYDLNEQDLELLAHELESWMKNFRTTYKEQEAMKASKKRFIVSVDMLEKFTLSAIQNIVTNWPYEYFYLEVSKRIEWPALNKLRKRADERLCRFEAEENAFQRLDHKIEIKERLLNGKCDACGVCCSTRWQLISHCEQCKRTLCQSCTLIRLCGMEDPFNPMLRRGTSIKSIK